MSDNKYIKNNNIYFTVHVKTYQDVQYTPDKIYYIFLTTIKC